MDAFITAEAELLAESLAYFDKPVTSILSRQHFINFAKEFLAVKNKFYALSEADQDPFEVEMREGEGDTVGGLYCEAYPEAFREYGMDEESALGHLLSIEYFAPIVADQEKKAKASAKRAAKATR